MFYNIQFSFWYLFFAAILTYLVWGFVVSFQVVLGLSGSPWALKWIKRRYNYRSLYREVRIFYPMVLLGYLFLELIPHYLFRTQLSSFDLDALFEKLFHEK